MPFIFEFFCNIFWDFLLQTDSCSLILSPHSYLKEVLQYSDLFITLMHLHCSYVVVELTMSESKKLIDLEIDEDRELVWYIFSILGNIYS